MFISEAPFYTEQPYAFPVEFFSKFQCSIPIVFQPEEMHRHFPRVRLCRCGKYYVPEVAVIQRSSLAEAKAEQTRMAVSWKVEGRLNDAWVVANLEIVEIVAAGVCDTKPASSPGTSRPPRSLVDLSLTNQAESQSMSGLTLYYGCTRNDSLLLDGPGDDVELQWECQCQT